MPEHLQDTNKLTGILKTNYCFLVTVFNSEINTPHNIILCSSMHEFKFVLNSVIVSKCPNRQ